MSLPITGFYTGLTIIIAIVLGMGIGFLRARRGVSILHNGDMEIATRMRAHGNLMETAALTLLAMAIIELNGLNPIILHGMGMVYIIARIVHPIGLRHDSVSHPFRAIGAMGSTLVMLTAGLIALWQFSMGIFNL